MRFPLFTILSIVPLLSLAQAYKYDSPLDAREYIDDLSTRDFDDGDLQLRADILADLSTRTIVEELKKRGNTFAKPKRFYVCDKCNIVVKTTGPSNGKCKGGSIHYWAEKAGEPSEHGLQFTPSYLL
ncbi:hypothetical protein DFP72DRAFT_293303 [Ephemerocybe angulata]|uniref:Uncharacterized protein n=1 Tax=Ephemerocybe angulata TaxID=980116 RepID=A0A8H6M9H9_9AGAR|nr:hypothetical protein DFP72DRAFT_293303 [Tulosesus angulatus]